MTNERVREIKHAQREAFLLRELSSLYLHIIQDNSSLNGLYINNVVLSSDGSTCTVYFHSINGQDHYETVKETLILYKPSMRSSLAKVSSRRYVPQLVFRYAEGIEKQHRINDLIEDLKKEGKL